jgi:Dolichyl-phosphate-mannose-protein mannosyltransferase
MWPVRRISALHVRGDGDLDWDRLAIIALIAGLIVRALLVFVMHPPHAYLYSDMGGYVSRAMQVVFGGGQGSRVLALYPPGTHLLLAVPFTLFGGSQSGLRWADAMWLGFSVLGLVFAWRLVRLLLGPRVGALTAILCAFYPLFILYSGFFTSETPSIALLCGALWLGYLAGRSRTAVALALSAGGGLLGGMLVAVRPQFLLNVGLVLVPLVRDFRAKWRAALGFGLGVTVVLAAIVALNSSNTGHLTGVSENGGVQFYQAHCNVHEVFTGPPSGPNLDFANPVAFSLQRGRDAYFPHHLAWDQGFFYREGLKCIGSDPLGQVLIAGREVADLTATSIPWPLSSEITLSRVGDIANILYCAALLVVIVLVPLILRRQTVDERTRSGIFVLLLQLAMVVPVAVVFGSEPRYRIPYDVFGLALAAWLLNHLAARDRRTDSVAAARGPT